MAVDHLFLDANILIDLLLQREPFWREALLLFNGAEKGLLTASCSSFSIIATHYQIRKTMTEEEARKRIGLLTSVVRVCSVTPDIISKAVLSAVKDFEDAVQYFTALAAGADLIVTRNQKDFSPASIPVISPSQYLKQQD